MRLEPVTPSKEELEELNRRERRTGVRRFLPYPKPLEAWRDLQRMTPKRATSLMDHPDERVRMGIAQENRDRPFSARVSLPRMVRGEAERALDADEVWNPVLDACLCFDPDGYLMREFLGAARGELGHESPGPPSGNSSSMGDFLQLVQALTRELAAPGRTEDELLEVLDHFESPALWYLVGLTRTDESLSRLSALLRDRLDRDVSRILETLSGDDAEHNAQTQKRTAGSLLADTRALAVLLRSSFVEPHDRQRMNERLLELFEAVAPDMSGAPHPPQGVLLAHRPLSQLVSEERWVATLTDAQLERIWALPDGSFSRRRALQIALERMEGRRVRELLLSCPRDCLSGIPSRMGGSSGRLARWLVEREGEVGSLEDLFDALPSQVPGRAGPIRLGRKAELLRESARATEWRPSLVERAFEEGGEPTFHALASEHPNVAVRGEALERWTEGQRQANRFTTSWMSTVHTLVLSTLQDVGDEKRQVPEEDEEAFAARAATVVNTLPDRQVRELLQELEASDVPVATRQRFHRLLLKATRREFVRGLLARTPTALRDDKVRDILVQSNSVEVIRQILKEGGEANGVSRDDHLRLFERLAQKDPEEALRLIEREGVRDVSERAMSHLLASEDAKVRERAFSVLGSVTSREVPPSRRRRRP